MIFTETTLPGVLLLGLEKQADERGFFARSFCAEEFAARDLHTHFPQANISFNSAKGTLRGMHYQANPKPEPKVVRCTRGAIFDVAVDLRAGSSTYCGWTGHELSARNGRALYVPPGCAHGFITLDEHCEVHYLMGEFYDADLARGVRWDDHAFAIDWPFVPQVISARDAAYPDFLP
ncbi:MAG: dTDP-4-dehydrorhamnose 3,5-epimerase [Kiloniellales bacterium]|nr:dTDP-4-dehydrorhamnose 3,5-epimerase [Kiloniellales bacterium]